MSYEKCISAYQALLADDCGIFGQWLQCRPPVMANSVKKKFLKFGRFIIRTQLIHQSGETLKETFSSVNGASMLDRIG